MYNLDGCWDLLNDVSLQVSCFSLQFLRSKGNRFDLTVEKQSCH